VSAYAAPVDEGMADREDGAAAHIKGEKAIEATSGKTPTVLFVCGGNTGRSFAAMEWTRFSKYGKGLNVFSRGSGISQEDSLTPEEPMVNLLLADKRILANKKERLQKEIDFHRATPASTMDIYNADIVLAMTASHKKRLFDLIDRECTSTANKPDSKLNTACADTDKLKEKIHTLIGCATGKDGDIADGYDKPASAYPPIYDAITDNIKIIMKNTADPAINNYQKNSQKPAHGMFGMKQHSPIYCVPPVKDTLL
jgi:protein-tyrosine-phosphatase